MESVFPLPLPCRSDPRRGQRAPEQDGAPGAGSKLLLIKQGFEES